MVLLVQLVDTHIKEIVGEINDEYDEEVREQIVRERGTYLLDGMLSVRDANKHLNLQLPDAPCRGKNCKAARPFRARRTGR